MILGSSILMHDASRDRLLLTAACIALAYFGVKAGWMAALRPALIDRLRRVAAFCGLDVRAPNALFAFLRSC